MPQGNGGVVGPANDPTTSTASGVWGLKEHAEAVGAGEWPPFIPALQVERSLRFNSADSAYLSRYVNSAGNRKTWTMSFWIKLGDLTKSGTSGWNTIFGAYTDNNNRLFAYTRDSTNGNVFQIFNSTSGSTNFQLVSNQVFRDTSSWYHFVVALDTTQATSADRCKVYVNGSQITSWATATYPNQNTDLSFNSNNAHLIGANYFSGLGLYHDGYLTEINFVDGTALTPSSFGETNSTTGVWQPKTYTGSYGTNGFYLPFSDNSFADSFGITNDASASGLNRIESGNTTSGFTVLGTMTFTGLGASPTHLRDNNPTTSAADGGGLTVNTAMGYDFGHAIAVRKIKTITEATTYGSTYDVVFNIQYSDDNSTWTTITGATTTHPVTSGLNKTNETSFDDNGAHRYWRLMYSSSSNLGGNIWISTLDMFANDTGPNSWWPNNFSVTAGAGNDSLVDTPTSYGTDTGAGGEVRGNYCTLNPLDQAGTLANGNLYLSTTSAAWTQARGTIGVSSGKWYWEMLCNSGTNWIGGISKSTGGSTYVGANADGWGYGGGADIYNNGSSSSYGATFTVNDVIGVALDLDAGTLTFYKNGVSQGQAASSLSGTWFPAVSVYSSSGTTSWFVNFGQRPFAHTAPSGFKALVTTNLPDPTVVQGDDYFNTVLYTGTGASQSITGVGFQPDWVWIKERNASADHGLYDAVRGVTKQLESNNTDSETTEATGLTAFGTDGFTVGALAQLNTSADTYVAWNWNAGGSTVSNTDGSVTTSVRANQTAGMSILTFTANGSAVTLGHGLGAEPYFIIVKARSNSFGWGVYHKSLGTDKFLRLNTDDSQVTSATQWQNTLPTSSVFYYGSQTSGVTNVAYCFAPIPGYSAFNSYTGNGSNTAAPFVYLGFRPAFVLVKNATTGGASSDWWLFDNKRGVYNLNGSVLYPNLADAEYVNSSVFGMNFFSNGFQLNSNTGPVNQSGSTHIFAAFAENPFKYSLAR